MKIISNLLVTFIEKYQSQNKYGSYFYVDCNFEPSCSEYTKLCIKRFGSIKGCILGFRRIRKCKNKDLIEKFYDPAPKI